MQTITEQALELTLTLPLFQGFQREQARQVIQELEGMELIYSPGDSIVFPAECRNRLLLLLSGRVSLQLQNPARKKQSTVFLTSGAILSFPWEAKHPGTGQRSMKAEEECRVLVLRFEEADESWSVFQRFEGELLKMAALENRRLSQRIHILTARSVREKIWIFLLYECEAHGADRFDIPFSRQQMADYLCVDRTTLSTELGKMQREGLLEYDRNHFNLLTGQMTASSGQQVRII